MRRALDLIRTVRDAAARLARRPFVAPCVRGGRVRVLVRGLVHELRPEPRDVEGWGVFRAIDEMRARREREAELPEIDAYLSRLPALRLYAVRALRGRVWLAAPVHADDMMRRFGRREAVPVRLCSGISVLDSVIARFDGASFWFDRLDRRADPVESAELRSALDAGRPCGGIDWSGRPPELRRAYEMAGEPEVPGMSEHLSDRRRLAAALRLASGRLESYRDRGEFWQVEWTAPDGWVHTSAIARTDLTVLSAGICLDEMDAQFDLQSLVGVVREAD